MWSNNILCRGCENDTDLLKASCAIAATFQVQDKLSKAALAAEEAIALAGVAAEAAVAQEAAARAEKCAFEAAVPPRSAAMSRAPSEHLRTPTPRVGCDVKRHPCGAHTLVP